MRQFSDQQVRYAPLERRLEQLDRAEILLGQIEIKQTYPYAFVCHAITGYRTDMYPDLKLDGADLLHDLPLFIDEVSASARIPMAEAGEPVLTVEELSKQFNISTKTANRWRRRGLASRRFVVDGRMRVGFLTSSVDRFVRAHSEEVVRSSRFSQLSEEERDEMLRRARRLAAIPSATLAEVSRRLARKFGRSPETVRYTIKNYDREHPDRAIFPTLRGALDHETRKTIFNSYRRGISIEELAQRFHRTRSSVYRIINQMRADRLLAMPLDYMYHESFDEPGAELEIVSPEPPGDSSPPPKPPAGLPPYLRSLYDVPLLTREQEFHLFRKMNYLLHRAVQLRARVNPQRAKASVLDRIEHLIDSTQETKRRLVRANLRLVVSIAKRHVNPSVSLFDLISDGNVSLIRAVEKFDFSRGVKFSTYASWAIMKNFARSIPAEQTHHDRFVTGQELTFELAADQRSDVHEVERSHYQMRSAVRRILDQLDERERQVIMYRYGLVDRNSPQTLEEVGNRFGVTKERIRQIELRAMNKLRQIAAEERLDTGLLN
jgi:RNA polymerase sigma factor (sigma-70 family)